MVTLKEIESFKDYGKCLSISNGIIEALVTLDLGPRVISFGFCGSQNFMCAEREELGGLGDNLYEDFFGKGRKWENLGGHRIWLSPESYPETYTPDDKPVKYEATSNGAIFYKADDTEIGAKISLELKMDDDDANMQVTMKVQNASDTPKDFAIWALSVCAKNGTMLIPMNTNDTGLLPNRSIAVWPYTDMSDDRIYWGKKYVTVKQNPNCDGPMKLGFDLNGGNAYYILGDEIFAKKYDTNHPNGRYPDGNCSFEVYTNNCMLEFETLGELKTVAPNEISVLKESWSLIKKPCEVDFKNDASIDNLLLRI